MADEGDKTALANSKQSVPGTCAIRATWHTCLFSCIRLFLDKLLKINSPCTPHMHCTVAFNNVMTECTYSYKKEGAVIRAHSVFARYWVTLKLDRTLLPKVELTLSIALSVR